MTTLRHAAQIAWRDIAIELRTRESLSTMLLLALMLLAIFAFGFQLRVGDIREVAPGVLWVSFAFTGMLGLSRSLTRDRNQGILEGLMLSPVDRGAIYAGKVLANLAAMLATEALILPLFQALFGVPVISAPLLLIAVLGSIGFVAIGTSLAAMTVNTRAREALLPVLLFPVTVPVLIAAVQATGALLEGEGWAAIVHWVRLLLAYDAIALISGYLTSESILEQ